MRQDLPQNNQDVKYMGSLLSYSGLTTKIRAMQSRLLTDDQYRELAELKTESRRNDHEMPLLWR